MTELKLTSELKREVLWKTYINHINWILDFKKNGIDRDAYLGGICFRFDDAIIEVLRTHGHPIEDDYDAPNQLIRELKNWFDLYKPAYNTKLEKFQVQTNPNARGGGWWFTLNHEGDIERIRFIKYILDENIEI